jgi:hypothetical protein
LRIVNSDEEASIGAIADARKSRISTTRRREKHLASELVPGNEFNRFRDGWREVGIVLGSPVSGAWDPTRVELNGSPCRKALP